MTRGTNVKYGRCWKEIANAFSKPAIREAAIGLLCLALTFAFFHCAVFPRTETFVCNEDNTYQYYPWMHKLAAGWRSLAPPLWDFSVDAGFPFSGEMQTAVFYPINIFYVWLSGIPTPAKLDALILFHFAAALWGMTLFLRQRGVAWWASVFGGAVFCWVGPVAKRAHDQANIFEGLIYLPWILYFFERGSTAKKPWWNPWTGFAGLTLALSLLAGHPQPFIYNGLMLTCFAVFLLFEQHTRGLGWAIALRRSVAALITVAVIAFLFTYVQLAAGHEYFARSYRWVGLANPVKALQVMPFKAYLISYLEEQNAASSGLCRVLVRSLDLIPPNGGDVFRLNTLLGKRSSQLINYFDFLSRDWSLTSPVLNQIGVR